MNLPNKLTVLRVIMIPFFVAALLYDGGANQNMRYVGNHGELLAGDQQTQQAAGLSLRV